MPNLWANSLHFLLFWTFYLSFLAFKWNLQPFSKNAKFFPFWAFYLIQSETFHSTNPLHKKPTTENNLLKRFFKIRGEQIITRTKQFKSLQDFRVLLLLPGSSWFAPGGGRFLSHNFCYGATILVWKVA